MNNPLGVSPSKGNQGTTRGKEKKCLDLCGISYFLFTRESLGELEKAVKHSPAARVPIAFLVLPNFYSCLYNSIETRYIFSIS